MMTQFTVLSHNAFWFQGVPFPGDAPPEPDPQILSRLCAIYQTIHPDVICLQEIQSQETFRLVSERLGMPGCYCPGNELPQYGGAVFWRRDHGKLILTSHDSAAKTQRVWQIVEVAATDSRLRICNIHLPSERQLRPERAAAQRVTELLDAIRSCETGPDIIAGDFNEHPHGLTSTCLQEHDYIDAAVLSNHANVPSNIVAGRVDYIWIKKQMRNRLAAYGVMEKQELACGNSNKQYLSDHLPLWITLEYQ